MTNVLVCVKRVVDTSGEVVLTEDGLAVDGRYAGYTIWRGVAPFSDSAAARVASPKRV